MRRSIATQFIVILAVVTALVLAGFAVMTIATRELQRTDRSRSDTTRALVSASELEQSVLDLETGLRGYLLSGNPAFLQPYHAALATWRDQAQAIASATRDDARLHALAASISDGVGRYVSGWAIPTARLAQRDIGAARREEAGGGGKQRVDALRTLFTQLRNRESALRSDQVQQASSLASLVFICGLVAIALFAVLIVCFAVRTRRRVVTPLRQLATGVAAIASGDLSARVTRRGTAEVGDLVDGFNGMAAGLERQREELDDHRGELEAQKEELETALSSLEQRNDHIDLLRRFGDHLAAQTSVEAEAAAVLEELADIAGCDVGALYLVDFDTESYSAMAWRGLGAAELRPVLAPGQGLAGRALAEGRAVVVSHDDTTMHAIALAGRRSVVHELHLPILHGERTIGVVSLGRFGNREFSEADQALLADLAERAAVDCAQSLATRRLEHTANELGALLESTDEGIYAIDTAGQVTLVNRAALELTGYTRAEVIGQDSHALWHHTREDGSPYPKDECPVQPALERGEGVRTSGEVFWRRDGTSFPVEYSSYPLFEGETITGAVVTFQDTTTRRQLQRQRDTQHALTRVFAETSSLEAARPLMLAAVCEGLGFEVGLTWGLPEEGDLLRPLASYAAPGHEDLVAALGGGPLPIGGSLAGKAMRGRDPVVCTDLERDPPRREPATDDRVHAAIGAPLIGRDGAPLAVVEFFTASVFEDGLADTLRALSRQAAQYIERQRGEEETQRIKDQIVANVSHELRTPLTAIDGWVHVLLGEEPGPLNDEQRRFLEIVKRNSDRLMRLVGDLLVAGQLEAGKLRLELEEVDVTGLAHETAELLASSARAKHIALAVHADAPVVVRGDRQRLAQLLSNLVANAIKFTPDEGAVDIAVRARDGSCVISVADTGIGIPKEDREHLFERFYRASSAAAHGIAGTGLGLAISLAIAESHQGTLRVAEHQGPGTVFIAELPLLTREEVYT